MTTSRYSGWRMPESTGLFKGLSATVSLVAVAGIGIEMFLVFFVPSSRILQITWAVIVAFSIAPAAIKHKGQSLGSIAYQWARTRGVYAKKAHIYDAGIFSPMGKARLPGIAAPIQLVELPNPLDGQPIGALINPLERTITITMTVNPAITGVLPQWQIDESVAWWGDFLRIIAEQGDVEALTVVTETLPETGQRHRDEAVRHHSAQAPHLATQVVQAMLDDIGCDQLRSSQRLSITFKYGSGKWEEGAASVMRRIPSLVGAADQAGLNPILMTSGQIIAFTLVAYDPARQHQVDIRMANEGAPGVPWDSAGPMYHVESSHSYLHDSGKSFTYCAWEFPMAPVREDVWLPILGANEHAPYKRVAVIYRPYMPSDGKRVADNDYRDAFQAVQRRSRGLIDARQQMRFDDIAALRDDIASGNALVRVGMLVTITVDPNHTGRSEQQALENVGLQTSTKFRPYRFHQAAAFAAGLGIGALPDRPRLDGITKGIS